MTAVERARRRAETMSDLRDKIDEERECRDSDIRDAYRNEGATIADLSRATGLTRTMLYKILERP